MEQNYKAKRVKITRAFLLCLLGLFLLLIVSNINSSGIEFSDPNLEWAIREKLNQPNIPITHSALLTITELDASNCGITNLEGIEYLNKLASINLAGNQIDDVTPLSSLEMLTYINLENNHITDLSKIHFEKLSGLPLIELNLSNNFDENGARLTNIQPLAGFKDIQKLNLRNNNISDVSILSTLPSLVEINLRDNNVHDIAALANLNNLESLNLHSNPVKTGINVLGNLSHLKTLNLVNIHVGENISFLEQLDELEELNLRNTSISDVSIIVSLMEKGALQDNRERNIQASVNLLENPFTINATGTDPFGDLRKYWDNISTPYPINLPYCKSNISEPIFSHQSGFYQAPFSLTLSATLPNDNIYFTLDGSEPDISIDKHLLGSTQAYTQPILIPPSTSNGNTHAAKNTENVENNQSITGIVVRAASFSPDGVPGKIVTKTFFLNPSTEPLFHLPVVSVATNQEYLFDNEIGLFTGDVSEDQLLSEEMLQNSNFYQRGLQWERPAALEFINPDGQSILSQNIGLRIHGGYSRIFDNKSLRLIASNAYDSSGMFNFSFHASRNQSHTVQNYQTLILRNAGNDNGGTYFRDVLSQSLLESTNLDIQCSQPVNVFINGEYWGIYNLRSRFDEHYFLSQHNIDVDDLLLISYIDGWPYVDYGNEFDYQLHFNSLFESIDPYFDQNQYATQTTLADQSAYETISNLIDIHNTIEYFAAEIYFNNIDWPRNNIRLWSKSLPAGENANSIYSEDEKLHWMISDIDFGFGNPEDDNFQRITGKLKNDPSTFLFRSLLENEQFKIAFINQIAAQLNTIFREEVVLEKINQFQMIYEPDMPYHIERWNTQGGNMENWISKINELKYFAMVRPAALRNQIINQFELTGVTTITFATSSKNGHIQINETEISSETIGIENPDLWTGIYFQGVPVSISAIPENGFIFDHWESSLDSINTLTENDLSITPSSDFEITAIFRSE
jgi:Leucine-rich repeat (LRR) protein